MIICDRRLPTGSHHRRRAGHRPGRHHVRAQVLGAAAATPRQSRFAASSHYRDLGWWRRSPTVHRRALRRRIARSAGRRVLVACAPYTRGLLRSRLTLETARDRRLAAMLGPVPSPLTLLPGCAFSLRCGTSPADCGDDVARAGSVGPGRISAWPAHPEQLASDRRRSPAPGWKYVAEAAPGCRRST